MLSGHRHQVDDRADSDIHMGVVEQVCRNDWCELAAQHSPPPLGATTGLVLARSREVLRTCRR
jgi:hypothetical protein